MCATSARGDVVGFFLMALPAFLLLVALSFLSILHGCSSSSSSGGSWIMANTRFPVPTCPAHCLAMLPDHNVGFLSCKSDTLEQQWVYDHGTKALYAISEQGICLEAVASASLVRVARCYGGQMQQWNVDQRRATVSISSPTMYLAMQVQSPNGSAWHDAALVGNMTEGLNGIMSLVPQGRALSSNFSMLDARSRAAGNLVLNGGFELSSYNVNSSSQVELRSADTFGSCGWQVVSGQVQLTGSGARRTLQGQVSMRLNGTISQALETLSGTYYVLAMLVSGCEQHGLRVLIAPSSMPLQDVSMSQGWSSRTYIFQAKAASVSLAFESLTGGVCGPFIDDVRVVEYNGGSIPAGPPRKPVLSSGAMAGVIAGASLAAFLAGGLCIAVTFFSFFHPSKSSSVHSRSTFGTSDSQGVAVNPEELCGGRRCPTFAGVRILSFGQVDKATHGFSTVLGKGSLGYVYMAEFEDGTRGATKRIFKMFQLTEMEFFDAVKMLGRVVHPNVVKLVAFSRDHGEQILVFEYMHSGTLYDRLHGSVHRTCLPWNTRLKVALDVATALEYLHHVAYPQVIHQRVKSANVFLSKDCKAKLADCGVWRRHEQQHSFASMAGYLDPHYLKNGTLTDKSDVYSFGVLLLELVTGLKAHECVTSINSGSGSLLLDPELRQSGILLRGVDNIGEVIKACMQEEAEERPNMSEVVEVLRQSVLDTQAETTPETRSRPNSPVTPS